MQTRKKRVDLLIVYMVSRLQKSTMLSLVNAASNIHKFLTGMKIESDVQVQATSLVLKLRTCAFS